jgi:hypothetical protein
VRVRQKDARERARDPQGGKRCLSGAGMGKKFKGIESVFMSTIFLSPSSVLFRRSKTGGVVRR